MSYFKSIKKFPLLQEGQVATPDELVKSHLRLVASIVSKLADPDNPFYEDMIQVGNLALIKSAETYDASKNVTFASYAIPSIRLAAMNYQIDNRNPVRMFTTKPLRKAMFNHHRFRTPEGILDRQMMADNLGIKLDDVRELERRLDTSYIGGSVEDDDGDTLQIIDTTTDPINVLVGLEYEEYLQSIEHHTENLSERERYIIKNRYLVDDPKTFKVLAEEIGVSTQRVDQIEKTAMKKLKKVLDKNSSSFTIET